MQDDNVKTISTLTKEQLQKTSTIYKLNDVVVNLVKTIDDRIRVANANGESYYLYELPNFYNAGAMSQDHARIIVFDKLIKEYEARRFNIEFIKVGSGYCVKIIWKFNFDTDNIKEMLENVQKHLVSAKIDN